MKKMMILFFIAAPVFAMAQSKETRNVSTFTKISWGLPGKLIVKQGSPQSVVLEGDKEMLSKIETDVSGGKLKFNHENKFFNWNLGDKKITVYVTVPNINALSVGGSGELLSDGKISTDELKLKVSGSGSLAVEADVKGELDAHISGSGHIDVKGSCHDFESAVSGSGKVNAATIISSNAEMKISGSGKIITSGTAQQVTVHISGSGKVLAADLEVNKCEAHISGSGDVEINVKDVIKASISGSGNVLYKGNPSHIHNHSSGSGSVIKM